MIDLLKNLKLWANERLDLNDVAALTDLKDADLKLLMSYVVGSGLCSPSSANTRGRVFRGFEGGPGTGLSWFMFGGNNYGCLAVAEDGTLVVETLVDAGTIINSIMPDKTCYLHAYSLPTDTDSDSRRFRTATAPYNEYSQTVNTRTSKVRGYYIKYVPTEAHTLDHFDRSTVIGGQTVGLVALYAFDSHTAGPDQIDNVDDFRQMLMPDYTPTSTDTDNLVFDDPDGGGPGGRSIHSMFVALAKAIKEIKGEAAGTKWWATPPHTLKATYDLLNATVTYVNNFVATYNSVATQWLAAQTFIGVGGNDAVPAAYFRPAITGSVRRQVMEFDGISNKRIRVYRNADGSINVTYNAKWYVSGDYYRPDLTGTSTLLVFGVSGVTVKTFVSGTLDPIYDADWTLLFGTDDGRVAFKYVTAGTGGSNPVNIEAVKNQLRAKNTPKSWGYVTVAVGVPTLNDGFNVLSVTRTTANILRIAFPGGGSMTDNRFSVQGRVSPAGTVVTSMIPWTDAAYKDPTFCDVFFKDYANNTIDISSVTFDFDFVIFGKQSS